MRERPGREPISPPSASRQFVDNLLTGCDTGIADESGDRSNGSLALRTVVLALSSSVTSVRTNRAVLTSSREFTTGVDRDVRDESVQKVGRLAETATHAFCGAPFSCGVR